MIEEKKYFRDVFGISETRYMMLFAYENVYGIFRPKRFMADLNDSNYYDLKNFTVYENDSPDDVLRDIVFLARAGKIELHFNDIIVIKLNGYVISYRFCGSINKYGDKSRFIKIPDFLKKEKEAYISNIHRKNMVLSILEGQLYYINSLDLDTYNFYCIDQETYGPTDCAGNVMTNYSLFMLHGLNIKNITPHVSPFVMLNNALYYFYKNREKNKSSLLLYDKNEMELLKDHIELMDMKLVI